MNFEEIDDDVLQNIFRFGHEIRENCGCSFEEEDAERCKNENTRFKLLIDELDEVLTSLNTVKEKIIINLHTQRTLSGETPLSEEQTIELRDYFLNGVSFITMAEDLFRSQSSPRITTDLDNLVVKDFKEFIQQTASANDQFEINIMKLKGFTENMRNMIEAFRNQQEDETVPIIDEDEEEFDFVEDENNTVLQN